MKNKNKKLIVDERAITSKDEDLLNLYPFAEKVQKIIQGYSSNPEPLTIGIYGKWGSGKTSFLNLIEKHIELFQKGKDDKPYIKFHYNPWVYQNKEEMLFDFFESLHRKLVYSGDSNLKRAGKFIKKYSRYLKAIKLSTTIGLPNKFRTGITFEPYEILQRLGEDLEGKEKSLNELKNEIDKTLQESHKKVIIFIDDVDRLDKDEIFTLFKLIKINADFKNLIFIVCLDNDYVSDAIYQRYGDNKKAGKNFLEKIINIPIELPLIEDYYLDKFIKQKIKVVFEGQHYKQNDYEELLTNLKVKHFSSPREIIRIINSFAVSFFAIGNEVNIHDLFWIEYIKIKYPKLYNEIKNYARGIHKKELFKKNISFDLGDIRKKMKKNHKEGFHIIDFLFPVDTSEAVSKFQYRLEPVNVADSKLRINHVSHFEKYFSFHTEGKLSEFVFTQFKMKVEEDDFEVAKVLLSQMINSRNKEEILFRLQSELNVAEGTFYKKYINFLIENRNFFSNEVDSTKIISALGDRLRKDPEKDKTLFFEIVDKLDYIEFCKFLKPFSYSVGISYKDSINKELIKKLQDSDKHPFFREKRFSKMTLYRWSQLDKEELMNYILKYFNERENIISFFKSLTTIYGDGIDEKFKEENYKYLEEELGLDINKLYSEAVKVFPEIKTLEEIEKIDDFWSDFIDYSGFDNVRQFAHLYLLKKGIRK